MLCTMHTTIQHYSVLLLITAALCCYRPCTRWACIYWGPVIFSARRKKECFGGCAALRAHGSTCNLLLTVSDCP
ncbi:hypothetical protein B0J11DRAFT_516288 [Dendryphion nanum]|uniref:Secreted protein n=1 Tax=Dendryphion nanum TaxID=256645 RepID=A0A9P9EK85_9PLEO|nr:hypothetical protein B0J11DRAFT_516288 [Dendryphion nanum]